jgi:hypothetical protein
MTLLGVVPRRTHEDGLFDVLSARLDDGRHIHAALHGERRGQPLSGALHVSRVPGTLRRAEGYRLRLLGNAAA